MAIHYRLDLDWFITFSQPCEQSIKDSLFSIIVVTLIHSDRPELSHVGHDFRLTESVHRQMTGVLSNVNVLYKYCFIQIFITTNNNTNICVSTTRLVLYSYVHYSCSFAVINI